MNSRPKLRFILHGAVWGLFLSALFIYLNMEEVSRYPLFLGAGLVMVWTAIDVLLATIKAVRRYREAPSNPLVDRSFSRE